MSSERELAESARAWPFEEARKLVARYEKTPPHIKAKIMEERGGSQGRRK